MSSAGNQPGLWSSRLLGVLMAAIVALLIGGLALSDRGDKLAGPIIGNESTTVAIETPPSGETLSEGTGEVSAAYASDASVTHVAPSEISVQDAAADAEEESNRLGIADFDFDLGDETSERAQRTAASSGETITVRKAVVSNGSQVGSVTVTIDPSSRLFLQGEDVEALLPDNQPRHPQLAGATASGLVSFQRLRELGVNLRYDPIGDRIELRP